MSTPRGGELRPDMFGRWLSWVTSILAIVLMGFCCWFVWRISMVAYQTEAAIVSISGDVKQISATGAKISQHLNQLDARLRAMEEKAADAINLDEVEHMLDEAKELRDDSNAAAVPISADTEREIKHLLACIRKSEHRFAYSDENKSGMRFYLQLYPKYKAYDQVLSSAEDFIDRVATTTIAGQPYEVVIDEKVRVALKDCLTEELKEYREK